MLKYITILSILILFSCSDDSETGMNSNSDINLNPGNMTAKVDGNDWKASQGIVFAAISTIDSVSAMSVTAARTVSATLSEGIGMALSNVLATDQSLENTYNLDGTSIASLVFTKTTNGISVTYAANSGMIEISEITQSYVKGTFNGVCVNQQNNSDSITITDGKFNATLTGF
ncbi:MAG: DUF5025 domain-containing protein [Calditrichae bacterium]|nr:DUF5025 domain-containing protein [Calditrichia bacterium]